MENIKYRYFVSYFVKLQVGDNGTGIAVNGHFETGVYEINHPLTTSEEVEKFRAFLQSKQNKGWEVILLGFSIMARIGA